MSNPCLIYKKGTIANPKIPRYEKTIKITKTTDSNGWIKISEYNKTVYFKNGAFSESINGNEWKNMTAQNLPTDIEKFDSSKMIASLNGRYSDSAGDINFSLDNNASQIYITGRNKYGSAINGKVLYNFRIDVYS